MKNKNFLSKIFQSGEVPAGPGWAGGGGDEVSPGGVEAGDPLHSGGPSHCPQS